MALTKVKQYDLKSGLWRRLGDATTLTPGAPPVGPTTGLFPAPALFPALTLFPTDGPGLKIGE